MHTYCEEVVVVQKKKNKTERKEKEGESDVWVIGSMFDAVKNRACVGIFDGLDLAKGKALRMHLLLLNLSHLYQHNK